MGARQPAMQFTSYAPRTGDPLMTTRLITSLTRTFGRTIAVLVLAALASTPNVAFAQNSNATIRGQVLDAQGALIPNATVVIVNKDTGMKVFNGHSDSSGVFVAPQVEPGTYKVTVTADGLKTSVVDNLIASVSQTAAINVNMEVGATTEEITVTTRGEELDRNTSNISTLISPAEVENLPLQSRNVENLLTFVPGVTHGGNATQVNTSQLSINGSRTLNTEVLLNGVSIIIASTGSPATLPSPDGVDELRFLTSTAPAEYGRTSGAVLAANTRGGTNKLHGSAYFLVRNEIANANTYFNKLNISPAFPAGLPRAKDRFFQPGGRIGGPIYIPHVYDGRNKSFFFVNYDRTLRLIPNTVTQTVPTLAQRIGDFSALLTTTPVTTIINPATGKPFPGNIVTGFDPAAAKIIAAIPLPNSPGTVDVANARATNNYVFQQTTTSDTLRLATRFDQQFGQRGRFSANLYRLKVAQPLVLAYNSALLNSNYDCNCSDAYITSLDYVHTFTPTLVMDLNMGFFRNSVFRTPPSVGLGASNALGIASLPLDQTPTLTITGLSSLGGDSNTNQLNITNTFTPFGTVTKTFGAHTFKMGGSLRKNQFNSFNPSGFPNGTLGFNGSVTSSTKTSGNPNNALADFELGKIKTGNYQLPQPETGRRNWNLGGFFQDDWKPTPKLSINAGLRYEYESTMKIANNIYSRFNPANGTLLAAGINSSASLDIQTPKADFSPRVGFSYSIDQKTVLRGAFGTFYGTIFQNLGGQIAFPGYDVVNTYNDLGAGIAQPFSLSQGFPLTAVRDLKNPFAAMAGATATTPFTISGVEFDLLHPMPLVQQYNIGLQRQLPFGFTLEANYVGNHALHLPTTVPVNIVPTSQVDAVTLVGTTVASQIAKPFPTLSTWTVVQHVGSSNYNALQVTAKRQFSTSLAVLSNYTFAKSLDDGSSIYNFSAPNGTANPQYSGIAALREQDYSVSSIDAKHVLNIALVYTTGFGPKFLRGFRVAPVFVGQTGLPINITQSNLFSNVTQQRPNGKVDNLRVTPAVNGTAIQYLQSPLVAGLPNPAFPLTPSGPQYATIGGVRTRIVNTGLGTLPRNALRGPGQVQFDASISKTFPVFEAVNFQIRLDAFNVINHTNLNAPNVSLTNASTGSTPYFNSASFGQITSAQPSRQLQLSGRLTF